MNGPPEMQTAALGRGDRRGNSKGVTTGIYPLPTENATDFARAFVARRLRLPDHLAALVAELAGIGATFP
jgi:hypothetical protein